MNNSELETLIRNILREQLVPATPRTLRTVSYTHLRAHETSEMPSRMPSSA